MIKNSIKTLMNNPVLVSFYVVYLIFTYCILFFLYPHNMSDFKDVYHFNFMAYGIMMIKMLLAMILLGTIGILFMAGYGNMLAKAVSEGRTTTSDFFPGIGKYFVRVLLSILLLFAFSMVLSIITSIISMPFILYQSFQSARDGIYDTSYINTLSIFIILITMLLLLFLIPLVTLWLPAIFLDDIGVIKGLQKGVKAGIKNYWKIILITIIIYLPMVIMMIFNMESLTNGEMFSPGMLLVYLVETIIGIVLMPLLYYMYKGKDTMINHDQPQNYSGV